MRRTHITGGTDASRTMCGKEPDADQDISNSMAWELSYGLADVVTCRSCVAAFAALRRRTQDEEDRT